MSSENRMNKVDVEAAFKSKNPRLLKVMPRFILNYIRRIVHEEDINGFLDRHGDKVAFEFVDAVITDFGVNVVVKGEENIREKGGVIFACNHPMGGFDTMPLMQAVGKKRKDVGFIVNDILLQIKNLAGLFVGINKHGKTKTDILETIDGLYASDKAVLIYPAGLVSRKQNGIIRDLEWKKSFITKAKKYQRDIIPVYIEGKNSGFFYGLANWRKRFGIKANIEMLYLMDEMYHQRGKTITVIFGKVISYKVFDKSLSDQEWAQRVKEHVYALPANDSGRMIKETI